nr:hypothetical protein [Tanacetum cinerariifolium]
HEPGTGPALRARALPVPASRAVHSLVAGRTGCRDRSMAGGVRRTRPASFRERCLPAPCAELAPFCVADRAVARHRSDPATLLHVDFAAAQQRPAHADG